jgi:CheY-like chemotaxis protein
MTPTTAAPTILLVDDYLDALEVWDVYLRSVGFNVLTAADGHQAVATVEAQRPDLVVMDLNLPGLSGVEVARVLRSREETRDLPLIAVTGYSNDTETDGARQAGFDAVIGSSSRATRNFSSPRFGGSSAHRSAPNRHPPERQAAQRRVLPFKVQSSKFKGTRQSIASNR